MALGESWFGGRDDAGSMAAVNIGRGVGAGIVINGNCTMELKGSRVNWAI
ncbi:ROK family protein [Bacillus licheniformis]|nr:ROK family protein [Bacillus licheniformis]